MEDKHSILFVDDEENILSAMRRLFRREGYEILTATGGEEALAILEKQPVSLIVSDQRMPQMIGAEFLARSREVSPNSIRMLLTGYSDIEAATQAINEGGIYRYITKPWDDEDLKTTVRAGLQRFQIGEDNRRLTAELQRKNAELEAFNERLEEKVAERTRELNLRVRELQGRDRIAQHMLSVHTLEETLEEVLQVAVDILQLDRAIIHLEEEDGFFPAAGIGASAPGAREGRQELRLVEISVTHLEAFETVRLRREPVHVEESDPPISPFVVVPILRGDDLLGLLEADNLRSNRPISNEELSMVASFALQAAIAISDAQSHQDFGEWKQQLDAVLQDVDRLQDPTSS